MMKKTGMWCLVAISGLLMVTLAACERHDPNAFTVAVATNFLDTARDLETAFEAESGFDVTLSAGSTGQIYSQITNGAPYHVFLAADQARPRRLVDAGYAFQGMRFTYATGRLVLWSPDSEAIAVDGGEDILRAGAFNRLAIANPDLAPYGAAARQSLGELGLAGILEDKTVTGQNVGQAFALVASGNADLGLVAFSQVLSLPEDEQGSSWTVPQSLYDPIRQDAVLLMRGSDKDAAYAFMSFLRSGEAQAIMAEHGYEPG
jgi:molybdate transport system substrate-binding protein